MNQNERPKQDVSNSTPQIVSASVDAKTDTKAFVASEFFLIAAVSVAAGAGLAKLATTQRGRSWLEKAIAFAKPYAIQIVTEFLREGAGRVQRNLQSLAPQAAKKTEGLRDVLH